MNRVRWKGKPRCKLLQKLWKEQDVYDPFIDIYPYTTLIQLKYFLGGIHHCVTVVSKLVFDSNFPFVIPLTQDDLDYGFINDNEKK